MPKGYLACCIAGDEATRAGKEITRIARHATAAALQTTWNLGPPP